MKKMLFLALWLTVATTTSPLFVSATELYPGGQNIGIEIRPDGLIISGTYDLKTGNTTYNPSRDSDIKRGDLLFELEGKHISSISEFIEVFQNLSPAITEVRVSLKRQNSFIHRTLRLVSEKGTVKTGLYIKERLLGIGTVSFYNPANHIYGALGHEIVDSDTGTVIEVKSGMIYDSSVTGISKSSNGNPGEKIASLDFSTSLGSIMENTYLGIYGTYDELPGGISPMHMALHDELKLGAAEIWTVTSGSKIEKYKIEITSLAKQTEPMPKGITFKVIDKELLSLTGGIVAGMSGSPIIQDNQLVGAVTHVLVDKVNYGYGIYMEWMYETAMSLLGN